MTPVRRVEQLAEAVVAHGDVGRDERARTVPGPAGDDAEPGLAPRRRGAGVDLVDPGQRGRLGQEPPLERLHGGGGPLDLDEHPLAVVADVPREAERRRQPVHEGPEPDALDHAPDPEVHPRRGARTGGGDGRGHRVRPSVTAASRWSRPKL